MIHTPPVTITPATDRREWDAFLLSQPYRPFLQSWAMGEVYRRIGQEPVRLIMKEGETVRGICFAHVVPARRGRHLSVPYGPVLHRESGKWKVENILESLVQELKRAAAVHSCSFIRMSPFWPKTAETSSLLQSLKAKMSPLHLLAEHLWYLPLKEADDASSLSTFHFSLSTPARTEEDLMKNMRSTTRNLIRRAEKEGVTVTASDDPVRDLQHFLALHDETRRRHGFTPYTNGFFRAQVEEFAKAGNVILYLARHQGQVLASSIHMTFGGETSYHHGASVISKIPASYLLQWTAIRDALRRGDHVYNFWGIAPGGMEEDKWKIGNPKHPFAGVTLFKMGFGGSLLELEHCVDIPLNATYYLTRGFESIRKWRRGF